MPAILLALFTIAIYSGMVFVSLSIARVRHSVSNSVLNVQYRGRYNTGISKMSIPVLAGIEFFHEIYYYKE
jgi:hypothetical protein